MVSVHKCPIETALLKIGKKWSINIIRDLFMGKKRFSEFLQQNPNLSTKMLSARLKDLEKTDIIEKNITNKNPVTIEYSLTKKGKSLNKLLYELCVFSFNECADEVCSPQSKKNCMDYAKKTFLQSG